MSDTAPAKERKWICLLACLAALRVFIFSAAFPFFNNVDEQPNFDLVVKYSRLDIPNDLDLYSPESIHDIVLYQSYAFMGQRTNTPPWRLPSDQIQELLKQTKGWQTVKNYECSQPPLYYALAGGWRRLGLAIGLQGEASLYWLRFLNIGLAVALVLLAYRTARSLFPENDFIAYGVPAVLACFPQSIFFAVDNDTLSALTFGLAFFWLIRFLNSTTPSARTGIALGLSLAAAHLTKMTNLPLLVVAITAITFKVHRLEQQKQLRSTGMALLALMVCAALPIGFWTEWCLVHFGDPTGSEIKAQHFGWVHKPFLEWWHHPIFTPTGFWTFLSQLLGSFWQGEFFWHGRSMASAVIDDCYAIASIIALMYAAILVLKRKAVADPTGALRVSLACVAGAIAFWGLLSTTYLFGDFFYPSDTLPYFLSGRLILGALIPFLLLFVYALDRAMGKAGRRTKFIALSVLCLAMLTVELLTNLPAFSNPYNWFHL